MSRCLRLLALPLVAAAALSAPARAPLAVPPIDATGLKKQVAARRGKVVVVNFWATWCGPCKDEFPDLVKLRNAHAAQGLDLVTVAFDEPRDVPTKVTAFLTKNKLTTSTFANKGGANPDEAYLKYLEPKLPKDEAFSLPRTYIFDRGGKLVKVLTGGQSYATFEQNVKPLLAKK